MATATEKDAVIAVLENFRANQQSYAVEPLGVDYRIMTPEGARGNVDIMRSIEHHDVMIARNILAPFMNVGQAPNGTRSSTEELSDVFFNSVESVANSLCSDSKRQLIKPLCDLNFDMTNRQYPTLRVSNIRKTDPANLSETMERLLKAGGLTYDEGIENMIRALLGFEPLDPALAVNRQAARDAAAKAPQVGAGDALDADPDAEPNEPRALSQGRAGARRAIPTPRRNPTDFETVVMSLNDIPKVLDRATDGLVRAVSDLRRRQAGWLARLLAAMSEANEVRPFAKLDPASLTLPHAADVERAIADHQSAVAVYGAEQVRLELKRQGAPVDLKHSASERVAFTLDDDVSRMELDTVASAVVRRSSVRSMLAASARNTAARLHASLIASIVDEATRLRRAGLVGQTLERSLLASINQIADANIAGPARGEINEAFGLGRAAEANALSRLIDRVVQSAILDTKTCRECSTVDGREMTYGSPEQIRLSPPYVECQGRENCRCVQLIIYNGRAA